MFYTSIRVFDQQLLFGPDQSEKEMIPLIFNFKSFLMTRLPLQT